VSARAHCSRSPGGQRLSRPLCDSGFQLENWAGRPRVIIADGPASGLSVCSARLGCHRCPACGRPPRRSYASCVLAQSPHGRTYRAQGPTGWSRSRNWSSRSSRPRNSSSVRAERALLGSAPTADPRLIDSSAKATALPAPLSRQSSSTASPSQTHRHRRSGGVASSRAAPEHPALSARARNRAPHVKPANVLRRADGTLAPPVDWALRRREVKCPRSDAGRHLRYMPPSSWCTVDGDGDCTAGATLGSPGRRKHRRTSSDRTGASARPSETSLRLSAPPGSIDGRKTRRRQQSAVEAAARPLDAQALGRPGRARFLVLRAASARRSSSLGWHAENADVLTGGPEANIERARARSSGLGARPDGTANRAPALLPRQCRVTTTSP